MVEINPRVNLYLFAPHPKWNRGFGSVAVTARDFQRAEGIAIREAKKRGIPGHSFSILTEELESGAEEGHWIEVERYRDVEDVERLVFMEYSERGSELAGVKAAGEV